MLAEFSRLQHVHDLGKADWQAALPRCIPPSNPQHLSLINVLQVVAHIGVAVVDE